MNIESESSTLGPSSPNDGYDSDDLKPILWSTAGIKVQARKKRRIISDNKEDPSLAGIGQDTAVVAAGEAISITHEGVVVVAKKCTLGEVLPDINKDSSFTCIGQDAAAAAAAAAGKAIFTTHENVVADRGATECTSSQTLVEVLPDSKVNSSVALSGQDAAAAAISEAVSTTNEDVVVAVVAKEFQQPDITKQLDDAIIQQLAQPSYTTSASVSQGFTVSISLKPPPLFLQGQQHSLIPTMRAEPGCTVFVQVPNDQIKDLVTKMSDEHHHQSIPEWCTEDNLASLAKKKILRDIELCQQKTHRIALRRDLQRYILCESEMMEDLVNAAEFYQDNVSANNGFARPPDVDWWEETTLFPLSLLRQLASGLDFVAVPLISDSANTSVDDAIVDAPWTVKGTRIATLQVSFLDFILQNEDFKEMVIDAIIKRLVQTQCLLPELEAEEARPLCKNLQSKLVQILNRTQGTYPLPNNGSLDVARLRMKHLPLLCTKLRDVLDIYMKGWPRYAVPRRSVPKSVQEERVKIRQERQKLIRAFEKRKKERNESPGRKSKRTVGRMHDGTAIFTAHDMPVEDFLKHTEFMEQVNRSIARPFVPGVSRPTFRQLNLSAEAWSQLLQLFFEADGSLRSTLTLDIDKSGKHGFINFQNVTCVEDRNDKRWQVPILRHSPVIGPVPTRSTVESILIKEGVINPKYEAIHDLGILIGGMEDQSLHHDIARQTTSWLPSRPSVGEDLSTLNPVPGWEINRLEYHEAMASKWAPCSVLFGLGDSDVVKVGIQKDQIIRCGPDGKQCKVINGTGEVLDINRENNYLVVVSARGCVFTGDFPHAGVKNFTAGSVEAALMFCLIKKLHGIMKKHPEDHGAVTKAAIEMLCNFPNLNKLCRMHCSTELLDTAMTIPRNAIGFVGCLPNPPKDNAGELDDDSEADHFEAGGHWNESEASTCEDDSDDEYELD